jgi:Kef-type K+ transport system membrane component KefB/mannitol/fructose-specific phosphotransferase system IIA component (Ntr-type)
LTAGDSILLLLGISIMLIFARGLGELMRRFRQAVVIGEIIAGIILGPTILGTLFPDIYKNLFLSSQNTQTALDGITNLAVVMLMLVSGLEVDLNIVLRQKKAAFTTSLLGILFPFSIGFLTAYLFPHFLGHNPNDNILVFALFVGTALSITALPVVARTLMDLKILKTEIGFLIIASAMFNDLIGWLIFSLILGMIGGAAHAFGFGQIVIMTLLFVFIFLFIGRKLINKTINFFQTRTSFPGGVLNFIFVLGFLSAAFTEYIGIHPIFGAFIAGIAIGDSAHLKESTRELIQQFVTNIFAPLFFVAIGLKVNFITNFDPLIVSFFILLAFIGKVVGCSIGARWGGLNKNESLAVGFGMNSRGAMEIVLGILALKTGLIDEKIFVALVIMALFTSITSAPLMSYFIKRNRKQNDLMRLLKPEAIFFSNAKNKADIITKLVEKLSEFDDINKSIILNRILTREEQMSTGIGHGIAIPHVKIKCTQPLIAVAVVKDGVDYNSPDREPAKIIFCLITPEDQPEVQLKLLADISKRFRNHDLVSQITASSDADAIVDIIKRADEK